MLLTCAYCGSPRARGSRSACWKCSIAYRRRSNPAERFWRTVSKDTDCWIWLGSKREKGYGQFTIYPGRVVLAHRYAWQLTNGPIPPRLNVLHRCDNPPCVNPTHLFLGTIADNNRDMREKGRERKRAPHGSENGHSKLTEDAVRDILMKHADGAALKSLAHSYRVSSTAIWNIVHGHTWKHVTTHFPP
jgi:hypothetical protein